MYLPYLDEVNETSKQYIIAFRGLNFGEGYQDGELSDCENLSSVLFPTLTQRFGRRIEETHEAVFSTALHSKDGLIVIEGAKVFYKGAQVGTLPSTTGPKQLATIGKYVVIFPDKCYINTATNTFGPLENIWSVSPGAVTFTDSQMTLTDGMQFIGFAKGDGVTISGCTTNPNNNKTVIIRGISDDKKTLTFYENTFDIEGGSIEQGSVKVSRAIPDLDFICESGNRLWGTSGNTIYGSAYGDPFNFQVFEGLAGDSYFIDVGSDGEFTGCIAYTSHICFFKENTLHKLYGSKPSNYQVVSSNVYGVQAGCERSLCVVNETLLYKGVNGVYAYTGGVPELISPNFGTVRFSDACAASDGERYYICMKHNDRYGLYVYDVLRNIWLKEDSKRYVDMTYSNGRIYLLGYDGNVYEINKDESISDLEWSATFCPFNETVNERKGYSKFHLRIDLTEGCWLTVECKTNYDKQWRRIFTTSNSKEKTVSIPIIPTRCDSVEIRLSGRGSCVIKTFIREFFVGSDM